MPEISVIICTYNPQQSTFQKCLDHLLVAASALKPLEILIIDNNSSIPVSEEQYIRDFIIKAPYSKIFVEKQQGLTPARLKGIKESKGDVLLFVDDDNFISNDFFLRGSEISHQYNHIGSWSGQVKLVFEERPPEWTKRYWGLLVYREFNGNYWSNLPHLPETMPCGAGLFVRKSVALQYVILHESGKRNVQLDRTASSLFSAGDNDLAACACDIGLGVGIFDSLVLEHYIPADRTKKEYLLKLAEGIAHSAVVFRSFRGELPAKMNLKRKLANNLRLMLNNNIERAFQIAVNRGEKKAGAYLKTQANSYSNVKSGSGD